MVCRLRHADVSAHQLLAQHLFGHKSVDHAFHQTAGLARVVGGKIAHIDVNGDTTRLGPGMYGQMGLRQQHRTRHPTGLAFIGRELHPGVIHQGQPRGHSLFAAKPGDGVGIEHVALGACALIKVGSQVQSMHVA